MTNILFTADWQCCLSNLDRCEVMLKDLLRLIDKYKPAAVVHLGDLKEAFNPVDQRVTNFLVRATKAIVAKTKFAVLLGNHDRTNTGDTSPSCLPVMAAAGAVEFENAGIYEVAEGIEIYMVPFIRDKQELLRVLRERPTKTLLLAFHAELKGCKVSMSTNANSESSIPVDALWPDDYALCVGGHIHHQQKLRDNVWYAGSPFQHDWRETNHRSGYLLVQCDAGLGLKTKVIRIPTTIPGYHDPDLPGFDPHADFKGAHVRIRVPIPVGSVPNGYIKKAAEDALERFEGAHIHVVPVFDAVHPGDSTGVSLDQGDTELIKRFLETTAYPEQEAMEAYLQYRLSKYGTGITGLEKLTFLDVEADHVLCFDKANVNFRWKGITLVTGVNKDWDDGSNGSGKSSALSLPLIALHGLTPKGQKGDTWGQRDWKGVSSITLNFQLADNRTVEIFRQRHPVALRVTVDGKDCTMGTVVQTQALIERLTRMSWEVANVALYIGQREVNVILTGTDKERKELLSQFLGLSRFFDTQQDINKERLRAQRLLEETQAERNGRAEALAENRSNLKRLPKAYDIGVCERSIATLTKATASLEAKIKVKEACTQQLQEDLEKWQTKYTEAGKKVAKLEHQIYLTQKAIRDQEDLGAQVTCPTCGAPLDGDKLKAEVQRRKDEIRDLLAQAEVVRKKEIIPAKEAMDAANEKRRANMKEFMSLNALLPVQSGKLAKWQGRLQAAQGVAAARKDILRRIREIKHRMGYHDQYLEYLQDRIQFLNNCAAVMGRDGLPAFLCATICPALNTAAAQYSELLSAGEINVQFEVSGGDLDIQIVNQHGGENIDDQSQGEMRLAGLIAAFALRDVLVPYNLLVLDEPGEGLDSKNARMFAAGLNEVAERFGSLFVVTHNPFILAELEASRSIEVTKENKVSTLKVTQ